MTDPTPQQNRPVRDDGPVMGDHRDLEEAEHQERRTPEPDSGDIMSRLMMPGIIVLVIVVIVIAYFLFVA